MKASVVRASVGLGLLGLSTAGAAPLLESDLVRAKTRVPRDEFCGSSFEHMGQVLTKHLREHFPRVAECGSFDVDGLRQLQRRLFQLATPDLLEIYAGVTDNRRERHTSLEGLEQHWEQLLAGLPKTAEAAEEAVLNMLRDGLCHEVVMRFVHHTSEAQKVDLAGDSSFVLPTLPSKKHEHDGREETKAAHREYVTATGCQACHSRLVPLPNPETPAACNTQLVQQCGKRGQLNKDDCNACVSSKQTALGSCTPSDTAAWCDHPDACIGAQECPVWPAEFAAPFGLYVKLPSISGAKAMFYYKYTAEQQTQTIDYSEKCIPIVNAASLINPLPCKLFFNPNGIYLSQPGRVDCCLFKAGVGAVPPEFLQSFKLVGQDQDAQDMYGNTVKCDAWEGPEFFKYWTVGHNDALYKNFGHDILFQDGPTGITWRWGNFQPLPAGDFFTLPGTEEQCSKSCPTFLEAEELEALHRDPHVRRAVLHHTKKAAQAEPAAMLI